MPHRSVSTLLCLLSLLLGEHVHAQDCPPPGWSRGQLLELKAAEFKWSDGAGSDALALALLPCLGDPDPVLRDGVAYEALYAWMRGKKISADTALTIQDRLMPRLAENNDSQGFLKPFAALALAEVARMDRIDAFMSEQQLMMLLNAATRYMKSIRDYRGFDEQQGWRHGVAHTSDLLLQLALNSRIRQAELDAILQAIASQAAPAGVHFYIYGEGERMARTVFFVAQRKLHSTQQWAQWLDNIASPQPLPSWRESFKSRTGLAKRHNTSAFLHSLYILLQENGDADMKERLLKPLAAALATIP